MLPQDDSLSLLLYRLLCPVLLHHCSSSPRPPLCSKFVRSTQCAWSFCWCECEVMDEFSVKTFSTHKNLQNLNKNLEPPASLVGILTHKVLVDYNCVCLCVSVCYFNISHIAKFSKCHEFPCVSCLHPKSLLSLHVCPAVVSAVQMWARFIFLARCLSFTLTITIPHPDVMSPTTTQEILEKWDTLLL